MSDIGKRFPFDAYPKGWFQVAYSREVEPGQVVSLQTDTRTGEMTRIRVGFARDFCKQIEQDIPIWESKIYRDRPQLARGEGAITEFRAWARQSYEEAHQ
jgi:hypothetical protein